MNLPKTNYNSGDNKVYLISLANVSWCNVRRRRGSALHSDPPAAVRGAEPGDAVHTLRCGLSVKRPLLRDSADLSHLLSSTSQSKPVVLKWWGVHERQGRTWRSVSTGYLSAAFRLRHAGGADRFHFHFSLCVNLQQVRCAACLLSPAPAVRRKHFFLGVPWQKMFANHYSKLNTLFFSPRCARATQALCFGWV